MKVYAIGAIVLVLTFAAAASATDLALWTFEVSAPSNAGPHTPESGEYAIVGISKALGLHADPNTVYSSPVGNGTAHSFSSNHWAIGDYYQFQTRTSGFTGIQIAWDQTRSSTGPTTFRLDYSTDGSTFTNLAPSYPVLNDPNGWTQATRIMTDVFGPISAPAALDNKQAVYFRLVSLVDPNAPAGTCRVDTVQITGTATGLTGACCVPPAPACTPNVTWAACDGLGGIYLGDGTGCVVGACNATPTGACCVGGSCAIQTSADCLLASGSWMGAGATCAPRNPCIPDMTIDEAKAHGAGPVRVHNVIVSSITNLIGSTYASFQVQDGTGGLTVFGDPSVIGDPNNPLITNGLLNYIGEGDQVDLEGTMYLYGCWWELEAPFTIPPVKYGHPGVPAPIVIEASDLADGSPTADGYVSELVRVNCLRLDPNTYSGNWAYGNYTVTGNTGSFIIRIATSRINLITTPLPPGAFDMVGIVTQYGTCGTTYELEPRSTADQFNHPDPNDPTCVPAGACCVSAVCSIATHDYCVNTLHGTWGGLGTDCTPNPCVGACCLNGACSLMLLGACTTPSIFLGNGSECLFAVCPTPVHSGDLALGLSDSRAWVTAQQIRPDPNNAAVGSQVGSWSSEAFLQSMEFDALGGLQHNHAGNLLGVDNGAGGGGTGIPPSCGAGTPPEQGAKLFSLATNGSNGGQMLWDFNSRTGNPNPHSTECTRGGGLSVSPDNQYLAFWGTDLKHLYVLRYHAGTGGGSGGSISNEYIYAGPFGTLPTLAGSIGTTWYSSSRILVHCTNAVAGVSRLYSVDFSAPTFSNQKLQATLYHAAGADSLFTDVKYNPTVSPYVYCLYSSLTSSVSYTYLDVIDPTTSPTWTVIKQINISASCQTGREIALGPDGYLYISQYAGSGVPRPYVDRMNTANVASWVDDSSVDYYVMSSSPVYSAYNGLDVAFGLPGACCVGTDCTGPYYEQRCIAQYGGTFKGEGVACTPTLCNPPPNGACCTPAGGCTQTLQSDCLTPNIWHGEWTSCTPTNPCPQPTGACCTPTGGCTQTLQSACLTPNIWHGEWTSCSPTNPCPQPTGACCSSTGCTVTLQSACNTPSVWMGAGTTCTPSPCTGACCSITGTCSQMTQAACLAAGGKYYENNKPCRTGNKCPASCRGDMNCDGTVTFADIDLFVAALAGEPAWTHWPCPWINGDCTADGNVTFADIDPFVARIGQPCP